MPLAFLGPEYTPTTPIQNTMPARIEQPDMVSQVVMNDGKMPGTHKYGIAKAERPNDIYYRMTKQSNWYYLYADIYKLLQENSLFKNIQLFIPKQLFRFDIKIEPRYTLKCIHCGQTYDTLVEECENCHGTEFRSPDKKKLDCLKKANGKTWIEEANNSGQSLKEVLKMNAMNQIPLNQSYLLCNTRTTYDKKTGEKAISVPVEFLSLDPIKVQQLFDDAGELGKTWGFTMEDRHHMFALHPEDDRYHNEDYNDLQLLNQANEEGKTIYGAAYKVGMNVGAAGEYWLYTKEEVYQAHWMAPSMTYGVPPWFSIMDDLKLWSATEKHLFKKYDIGVTKSVMFIPGANDDDVDQLTQGLTESIAINDSAISVVALPPSLNGSSPIQPQVVDLGTQSDEECLAVKNDCRDRICTFCGIPNIFAGDVAQSGGMNNESQQIAIFDRTVEDLLAEVDRELAWFQSWFPDTEEDWRIVMDRPTKTETDAKKRIDRMQEAQIMTAMGYIASYKNGEFSYSETSISQQQQILQLEQMKMQMGQMQQQMMMQQQQMMMQAQQPQGETPGPENNGVLPGDGEGPPEKGTARREDHEIDEAKNEIEQTEREAE